MTKVVDFLLIVDDSEFDADIAQRVLRRTGRFKRVAIASNGREALALIDECTGAQGPAQIPPQVILLDINMPLMNGFDFLERYQDRDAAQGEPSVVVVMLTSSSYEEDRERAMAKPCVRDYFVKPLTTQRAIDLAERFGRPSDEA
ncbi:response regulator [Haliangium ochraceum]|uniref:Response regulator receiver protein n=1 Tax=Haliangium ochraceum (strain DSM 14365 / JCM 11303 / SMP-2) TaxID=502025 RepID=D0LR01_HALO1|nr:response regulator [Haliangium ochraceum]ACY15509.1 response regulator receiver protein [Haliangium ochraceum DSM 14365]